MERSEEIRRVVERWLAAGDAASRTSRVSEHPGLVLIGSDPNEWWQGPEAHLVFEHRQGGEAAGSLKSVEIDAWEEGSYGWAAAKAEVEFGGVTHETRVTCVLHLERGEWKVVQGHFSLPQTNQSLGLEAVSTFEELVQAARDEQPDLPASLSRDGTVTIVFTDIVDSTLLLSRLGDAARVEVIRRHNELIDEVTAAHGGTVVETQADGSMLAFPSARGAVTCSQAIQHAIERAFADFSPPIRVRIGIHTGDAIQEAEHFFGTTVHYAARVAAQAIGGEVLVSSLVRELVGSGRGAAETAAAVEQPAERQAAQLVAEGLWRGHDHRTQLCQCFAAHVDGAAAGDQQQSQCLAALARTRERELVAGQGRPRDPEGVKRVVLAGQSPLCPWCAADLEHGFALLTQITGQTSAVAACALDRPGPLTLRQLLGKAQRSPITTAVRHDRSSSDHGTRRRRHHRQDVLIAMGVDAEHVVQLVCKHQTRSSDSLEGSGGAGLKRGKPRRQIGKSHAPRTDTLLIKPAAGARPAPPRTGAQFIPKTPTKPPNP